MARLLVWILLIVGLWWLMRPRPRLPPGGPAARRPPGRTPEAMVDCARCGLHLPASEALRDTDGRAYCCAEHRAAGPR